MRIIRAVVVPALLVCLLCVSASFAWMNVNKGIESRNIAITVEPVSDVTTISCYALRYDGSLGAVCYKIGEGPGEVLDVTMTEFDRIFRDRVVNTPLIYVLELGHVPNNAGNYISLKVPCTEKFILPSGGVATNDYTDTGAQFAIQDYISNIISVKVGCGGRITEPTATLNTRVENNVNIFNTQMEAFRNVTSGEKIGEFVSVDKSGASPVYSKTSSVMLRLSQSEYGQSVFTAADEGGGTSNHLTLYIQFDYDEAMMDEYISHMPNDLDTDITFENDLAIMQMLIGSGNN